MSLALIVVTFLLVGLISSENVVFLRWGGSTGYRSQVTIKNTCEFAVSSYLVVSIYLVFF